MPIGKLAAAETRFVPIMTAIQSIFGKGGGSGLYWINTSDGVVAAVIVFYVSRIKGSTSIIMIILAGMVVGAMFSAFVSLVKYVADSQDVLPTITFWLMGSLLSVNFERLLIGAPLMIGGTALLFLMRRRKSRSRF